MSTFVLVHGAWHGGWCWRRVADRLEAKGHKVFAPTLSGLGDRSHMLRPDIGVDTHATDIAYLVAWERIADVVLVGHSYGGMVITEVAGMAQGAIGSLVMLDAFFPEPGESVAQLSARTKPLIDSAQREGRTTLAPIPAAVFLVNEADRGWVDSSCTPQPIKTFLDPATAKGVAAREKIAKKAFIRARATDSPWFDAGLAKARATPGWKTYEVPCGHDVMIDLPERLVEILLEVA